MNTGIIYCARNEINLKSYVGQTLGPLEKRKAKHLSDARNGSENYFHRAIRKYGEDAFTWRVLEEDIPEPRINNREPLWIDYYDSFNNGYNSRTGGSGGTHSEATKAKMSASHLQLVAAGEHHTQSPEWREQTSAWQRERGKRGEGPPQSPEARAKASATRKAMAARGELHQQQPGWGEKHGAKIREKSARGELPQNDQRWRDQHSEHLKYCHARNRRKKQEDAGQQFLF